MLNEILIYNLFGRFNYNIILKKESIFILTGPNGFGKTTILKAILAISEKDIDFFYDLKFDKMIFRFSVGRPFTFEKLENELYLNGVNCYTFKKIRELLRKREIRRYKVLDGESSVTTLDNEISSDNFLTRMQFEDYLFLDKNTKSKNLFNDVTNLFDKISKQCGKVKLISEQRIIKENKKKALPTKVIESISELPLKLLEHISAAVNEYSRISNFLDSSYPQRLFETAHGLTNIHDYMKRQSQANIWFQKLSEYDLVDNKVLSLSEYRNEHSTALKIYFEDLSKKYMVFEKLISKLDLFTKIINERLLFKSIKISREHGFAIIDDTTNEIIELNRLSSGEKQEIILFYDLIFDSDENVLLLIDEPEISLHISWQKRFLDDLLKVSQSYPLKAIIATHSPQIINNHWDIQIDLGALYANELNTRKSN